MKFLKILGQEGSYHRFAIEGGSQSDSIGDQTWVSPEGDLLEVHECVDQDVLEDTINLFKGSNRRAFKGACQRVGIEIDY